MTTNKNEKANAFTEYYLALFGLKLVDFEEFKRNFIEVLLGLDNQTEWLEGSISTE